MKTPDSLPTFRNQNARAKVRLELAEGVLVEIPLVVIVRAIQEQMLCDADGTPQKKTLHMGFADFWSDQDPPGLVHLIVTTEGIVRTAPGEVAIGVGLSDGS